MDTTLITGLLQGGVAGVVAVLFILGLIFPRSVVNDLREEVSEWKQAASAERDRADAAVAAAQATRDMMTALQAGLKAGARRSRA